MKKELRLRQVEARETTRQNNKGIINMPTGTGKSVLQAFISMDNILGPIPVQVVLSPRILLADQLLHEVREIFDENGIIDVQYLIVHSGLTEDTRDLKLLKDVNYRDMASTTSPNVIRQEYERSRREGVPLIISGTYHSAERIMQAGVPIYVTHCDEAHYLRQPEFHWITFDEPYSKTNKAFTSIKKYFYTATLRNGRSDHGRGMNNDERYGKILYQRLPLEMIYDGEIVRPRMHIVDITTYEQVTEENELNMDVNAILQAFIQHRAECKIAPKMLITTKGSKHLNDIVNHVGFQNLMETRPNLTVFDITSEHKARINNVVVKRKDFFKRLRNISDTDEAIILHINILTEGIDVPGITGVMLMNSCVKSMFLQNLGRATRLHKRDRERLYNLLMKADELHKFVKPYAYIIIPIYGNIGPDLWEEIKDMIYELRTYGFNPAEDVIMSDSKGNIPPVAIGLLNETDERARRILSEFIQMRNEVESEVAANDMDITDFQLEQKIDKMSIDELILSFGD